MLRSRLFQNLRLSGMAGRARTAKRSMGSAGHHDHGHHAPSGPYAVPHHATYPNEAYFLGINPNEPYQWQGFEIMTIATYVICAGILFFGSMTKDRNSFKNWARREALARREVRENGGEIEFGKWYSTVEYAVDEENPHGSLVIKPKV